MEKEIKKIKVGFHFEKDSHTYTFDGRRMTGITSIISVLAKPALIGWAARMATEYLEANLVNGKEYTESEWSNLFTEAKKVHTNKKDKAAEHGTSAHELVESWIKDKMAGNIIEDEKYQAIKKFTDWADENVKEFLFSERQMYNEEMFIAGTADFGAIMKDGERLIGDFKTSSGVYGIDYFLQCSGYKLLAEAEGDEPYDGCVITRLGKDGSFDVHYGYDTDSYEAAFMACLTIYRAQARLKKE